MIRQPPRSTRTSTLFPDSKLFHAYHRKRLPLARLPAGLKGRCAMDLSYGPEYEMFREEVRGFIAANRHLAPTNAGRAARPSKEGVAWQKLLIQHGYTARTIPREYGEIGRAHV